MSMTYKTVSLAGVLLASIFAIAPVTAQTTPAVVDNLTLQEWLDFGAGGYTQADTDKNWVLLDSDFSGTELDTVVANFTTVRNVGGIAGNDVHTLTLQNLLGVLLNTDRYLDYSIEILVPPAAPGTTFGTIGADSTVDSESISLGGSTSVTKTIYRDAIGVGEIASSISVNGGIGAPIACSGCTKLYVRDEYATANGGLFSTGINSYRQVPPAVPEPAALGLIGIGMAGMGFVARRRRKA